MNTSFLNVRCLFRDRRFKTLLVLEILLSLGITGQLLTVQETGSSSDQLELK